MLQRLLIVAVLTGALAALAPDSLAAESFPTKPMRIVTQEAGGSGDFSSRLIGQGISGPLGQPVIVENRTSITIAEIVAKAPPDGYTMMHAGSGFMFTPLLQKVSYDPVRDYAPITIVSQAPLVLVVNPALPVKSVKELIALAKSKPGSLNFAATSPGGGLRISGELFKSMAAVDLVLVQYKGAAAALNGVVSGEVQLMFADPTAVAPHAKSGKLRALAVTSPESSPLYPGLPTVAASGVPGYEIVGFDAMWAPARVPVATVARLNEAIVRFLRSSDAKEKYLGIGVETVGSSPEQLAAAMKSAIARTAKVIKEANIRVQ